jgi:hypothetical protein
MDDSDARLPPDLVRHVALSTGLDGATASRVVADVMAYFGETAPDYVVRRHEELKQRNRKNDEIWPVIMSELRDRRFRVQDVSERQLRRMVYG